MRSLTESPSEGLHPAALVIVPTYNERDNVSAIVDRILCAQGDVHVLIVDDNSPDGTGDIADSMARTHPRHVHVMHRTGKQGLGAAYLAGFAWGLKRSYPVLVEMDADGSHLPEQLYRLLDAVSAGADLVIGSRYVQGGEVLNWPLGRKVLSRGGNLYARIWLGSGVRDITAGYRAYRREVLEKIDLPAVRSRGYCFQVDLAWRAIASGFDVMEVPVTFVERELGASKMSGANIREAIVRVPAWGVSERIRRTRERTRRSELES